MLKQMLFVLGFVLAASVGFAQEEGLELEPHFINLIAAFTPVMAYIAVFFLRKAMGSVPAKIKPFLVLVGPALSLVVGIVNGQVDGAATALLAAAWGGLATVIYEIQKGISKAANE